MATNPVDTCVKDFCHDFYVPQRQQTMNKILKSLKVKPIKYTRKKTKTMEEDCRLQHCNPECAGTLFKKGKAMPKLEYLEKVAKKDKKMVSKMFRNWRKDIFQGKTNVLKNSFYEKIPLKTRKILKRKGALSGCTPVVSLHFIESK